MRLFILNMLVPLVKWVGKVHLPFTHKLVTGHEFYEIQPYLKPGAVLLSYKRGELSNAFIPGQFTHAAILLKETDKQFVIEAIGAGVVKTDLVTFMTSKDRVAILYPTEVDEQVMELASRNAEAFLGVSYDYYFAPDHKAFYCSELIADAYQDASPKFKFESRERLGIQTIVPSDFYASAKSKSPKWVVAWDSLKG